MHHIHPDTIYLSDWFTLHSHHWFKNISFNLTMVFNVFFLHSHIQSDFVGIILLTNSTSITLMNIQQNLISFWKHFVSIDIKRNPMWTQNDTKTLQIFLNDDYCSEFSFIFFPETASRWAKMTPDWLWLPFFMHLVTEKTKRQSRMHLFPDLEFRAKQLLFLKQEKTK